MLERIQKENDIKKSQMKDFLFHLTLFVNMDQILKQFLRKYVPHNQGRQEYPNPGLNRIYNQK